MKRDIAIEEYEYAGLQNIVKKDSGKKEQEHTRNL